MFALVAHEVGNLRKEGIEEGASNERDSGFIHGLGHQFQPAIAFGNTDAEGNVAHPETWVSAMLQIRVGMAQAEQQEFCEALFRTFPVISRIHRADSVIVANAAVERRNHGTDSRFAAGVDHILFRGTGHGLHSCFGETFGHFMFHQLGGDFMEVAGHDGIQIVGCEADAVIGTTGLRKVIGSDFFRAVSRANQGSPILRVCGLLFLQLFLVQAGAHDIQGQLAVFDL